MNPPRTSAPQREPADAIGTPEWASGIRARAAAYWTESRLRNVLGGKNLILPPVESAPLLRVLGLLHGDGSMPSEAVRKYMQINQMVALLEPPLRDLVEQRGTVRLLDVGCGSSYLTLLLAWCFAHRWGGCAQLLGIDRNRQVIDSSRDRACKAGLDELLRFEVASVGEMEPSSAWRRAFGEWEGELDALVALHACDTATDGAIALGVRMGAKVIAVVPCCQAELAQRWAQLAAAGVDGALAPVWSAPQLRRQAAATLTDAMRMLLMRAQGYRVTAAEFVPMEHTPKNTLIRAVKQIDEPTAGEAMNQYRALCEATGGVGIGLEQMLGSAR